MKMKILKKEKKEPKLDFEITWDSVIEKEKEHCAVCHTNKGGSFLIITVGAIYVPICEKCVSKKAIDGVVRAHL